MDRPVYGGQKVWVSDGATTKIAIVPTLHVEANRALDTCSGTGPSRVWVDVHFTHSSLEVDGWHIQSYERRRRTALNGRFSVDFTSSDNMMGGDWCQVSQDAKIFTFYRGVTAPMVTSYMGQNYVSGFGKPLSSYSVQLKDSAGATMAALSGRTPESGWFGGRLFDHNGLPVEISAGDKVQVSGAASIMQRVKLLTARANANKDRVKGSAPPTRIVVVYLKHWWGPGTSDAHHYYSYLRAKPNASYEAFFLGLVDSYDTGDVMYRGPEGDQQYVYYVVP